MRYIYFLVLIALLFTNHTFAQISSIALVNPFSNLDVSQSKVVNYVNNLPRNGTVKYINWVSVDQICNNGKISIALPDENNGQPIDFELLDVDFASGSEYSLHGRSDLGNISLYITPQGIGGTIDLVTRVYSAFPLGGTKGTLIELLPDENDRSVCGTEDSKNRPEDTYCGKECGASVLDILALVTPEARQWVTDTWGWVGDWFLFVETHNINGAFINSAIPNKRVRVKIIDYTPDFDLFPDIYIDMNTLKSSQSVKQLAFQNGADISILLTNSGYGNINNILGAIPSEQGDPTTTNKVGIVEVSHIGPINYVFAHEVAHHFGCWHSFPIRSGCSNGKYMEIGRNTIMGTGSFFQYSPPYSKILHFSNPDVLFGGEPTGDYVVRDNAAQIRGAFCEVANNLPEKFGVSISKSSTGPICTGETHTFTSDLFEGNCIDLTTLEYYNCTSGPYQYEWSISNSPAFTNSQVIGNASSVTFTLPYCPLYIRVTVSSANGLTTTATQLYNCAPGVVCNGLSETPIDRSSTEIEYQHSNIQCVPNPASDQISVFYSGTGSTAKLTITDLMGRVRHTENISGDVGKINLDVSALEQGAWFLQIEGANTKQVIKFFIIR